MLPIAVCCEHCLELIAREKPGCARIWMMLCASQRNGIVSDVPDMINFRLSYLEKMGFITTTDQKDTLSVKVHGHKTDGECSFFCTGKCKQQE